MALFNIHGLEIEVDYPRSTEECEFRLVNLHAKERSMEALGNNQAVRETVAEIAILEAWKKSSYFKLQQKIADSTISSTRLQSDIGIIQCLHSIILNRQKQGLILNETEKTVMETARELMRDRLIKMCPPEELIPDEYKVKQSAEEIEQTQEALSILGQAFIAAQAKKAKDSASAICEQKNTTKENEYPLSVNPTQDLQSVNERMSQIEKQLERLSSLSNLETKFQELTQSYVSLESSLSDRIQQLEDIEIELMDNSNQQLHKINSLESHIVKLESRIESIESKRKRVNNLSNVPELPQNDTQTISQLEAKVERVVNFIDNQPNYSSRISNLELQLDNIQTNSEKIKELETCVGKLKKANSERKTGQLEKTLRELQGFVQTEHEIRKKQFKLQDADNKFIFRCLYTILEATPKQRTKIKTALEELSGEIKFVGDCIKSEAWGRTPSFKIGIAV